MQITHPKARRALAFICGVIIVVSSLNSCNLGVTPATDLEALPEEPSEPMIPPDEPSEPMIDPGEPPPDEPSPGGETQIQYFVAHRTELQPGECTGLEWQVEGGFQVNLNDQQVDFGGLVEVCPAETTEYWLTVDAGDRMIDAQVTVHVEGSSLPDDGNPPPEPTQPSAPTPKPPTVTAPSAPQNCNKTSNEFITDLGITDIYPGNMPKGQFWVRVTNHGPVACQNVTINFLDCTAVTTPHSGASGFSVDKNLPVTLNIKPGETQNIPTGLDLDTDKAVYFVTCSLGIHGVLYSDLDNNNHYYQETIP